MARDQGQQKNSGSIDRFTSVTSVDIYNDANQIGEILYRNGLLDETGLVKLQEAELYITDRLAQDRAKQLKESVPHAHQTTALEIIVGMKLAGPNGPLDEHQIVEVLAREMGYPFMRLQPLDLDPDFVTKHLPQKFADRFLVIPVDEANGKLRVAICDPSQREVLEDVSRVTGKELEIVVSSKSDIMKIILEFHGFRGSIRAAAEKHVKYFAELADLERLAEVKSLEEISHTDRNIRTAVDAMFRRAISLRASDIHIEPKRGKSLLRMRIDGTLHDVDWIPGALHGAFTSRIKAMSAVDIAEKRRPQDGRIKLNMQKREIEVRVSTVPTAFGEKTVCRIQDPDLLFMDLEQLGFSPYDLTTFQSFIYRPYGIILVTGPTGSGKTTTLYSALKVLATADRNITCIEDPVEMVFERFNQIAVNPAISMLHNPEEKMTFGPLLRHVMRQDPDVIMIGEIRDEETASLAVQAALTGHLVFSTLHTNDALTAVNRMLDLKVPSFLLSGTVVGLIAQRLIRKICPYCSEEYSVTLKDLNQRGFNFEGPEKMLLKRGKGCHQCRGTGYFKMESVYEVVGIDDDMAKLIVDEIDMLALKEMAKKKKFRTLWENAVRKMLNGVTTVEEVLRVTQPDPHFNEPMHLRKMTTS
ncbi:MAG TPA: GspE/PulE family protein [Desulfomonilaceae bacterium]|nr:GspE/PulE family protein [Desulfomonilaceae bacterium]